MGAKHTPGPWVAEPQIGKGAWVKGSDGQWAALSCGTDDANGAANARLIASAPDLLEALRQLLGNAIVARHQLKNTEDASLVGSALWDTIGQAEKAIARATLKGKSHD